MFVVTSVTHPTGTNMLFEQSLHNYVSGQTLDHSMVCPHTGFTTARGFSSAMTLLITMVNLKTWTILEHEAKAVRTIHRMRIGSMATIRGKDWERKLRAKTEQFIKEDNIPWHVRLCYREGREPIPYAPLVSVWSWQRENQRKPLILVHHYQEERCVHCSRPRSDEAIVLLEWIKRDLCHQWTSG